MDYKEYLLQLLSESKTKQAIDKLLKITKSNGQDDLNGNISLLSSRFYRNEDMFKKGVISDQIYNLEFNRINNSLKDYIKSDLIVKEIRLERPQRKMKNVFISYSRKDLLIAKKIKSFLESNNVTVDIDFEALRAGENIKSFIERSIRNNSVVISLVSKDSLLSSWVALEAVISFNAEKISEKKFIAAFIDGSFFKRTFVDDSLNNIEKEINDIQRAIKQRLDKQRNITDLQDELERYKDLYHNLPKIIQRLTESLSVNITDSNFNEGMSKVLEAIESY
jgi:TIR domain/Effector-associated domain 11